MLENLKILGISIICLAVGGFLFWKNGKKLKETEERDMLWAYTFRIFLDSILFIGIGITCVVFLIIKLFN
jgi:steroid 5-alpha reductase family enzyme